METRDIVFDEEIYKEDKLKEKIELLLKIPGNEVCVECGDKDPQWASTNLGVFICISCSGIHRNLGVHISRVRSLYLDNWKKEELESMRDNGNQKSKAAWEVNLPKLYSRPIPADSIAFKEQYIRAKYERKEYHLNNKTEESVVKVPYREGYLTKRGIVVKNWKRRWFILSGTVLFYFKKPKEVFPAGELMLKDATEIDCLNEPMEGRNFCFTISMPGREWYICGETAKDMYDWVQICRGVKKLLATPDSSRLSASEVNTSDIVPRMSSDLDLQKRKLNKKAYANCFIGASAIDWLVFHLALKSREEAVTIGQKLINDGFIESCTSEPFADGYTLYQFIKSQ